MAKASKKKTPKQVANIFRDISKASVSQKSPLHNGGEGIKHYSISKLHGVNDEVFQVRIVDTGMVIHAEVNLEYTQGEDTKLLYYKTFVYGAGTDIKTIRNEVHTHLRTISIINQVSSSSKEIGDIFELPKKRQG